MWLNSARNSSLTLPSECEWVSKSAPPAAQTSGKTRPARWGESRPILHGPLEAGKGDDQQHEQPVLRHFRDLEAFPEAARAKRPIFRVCSNEQEYRQSQEHERPMARHPKCPARKARMPMASTASPAQW